MLYYIRDDKGYLLGFKKDGETYFYQKNIQEDITGIYNKDFELLATYDYDAWGRVLSIKNQNNEEITEKSHIAYLNPFRYRSYYYDEETSLYYLNSRYYNPEWGRFLNADGIIGTDETTIGYNLYTYCDNTPVNGSDSEGNFTLAMIGAGIAAIGALLIGKAFLATQNERNINTEKNRNPKNVVQSKNINKLPTKSKPNSTAKKPNGDLRIYGPDGKATKDIDSSHPEHHPELQNPHIHDWNWDGEVVRRGPARNPKDGENLAKMAMLAGVGYLTYRGLRMLPSFLPSFWWTIPVNFTLP